MAGMPTKLTASEARKVIKELAQDTENIFITHHALGRMAKRGYNRRQVEVCCQKGTITEGPFVNEFGNWQVNLFRHAAGEQMTCGVAIEWRSSLVVRTVI